MSDMAIQQSGSMGGGRAGTMTREQAREMLRQHGLDLSAVPGPQYVSIEGEAAFREFRSACAALGLAPLVQDAEGTDLSPADRRAERLRREIAGLRVVIDRPTTPEFAREGARARLEAAERELAELLADPAVHGRTEAEPRRGGGRPGDRAGG